MPNPIEDYRESIIPEENTEEVTEETTEETQEEPTKETTEESVEDVDKFKDKSREDILKSYQELERMQKQTESRLKEMEIRTGLKESDIDDMKEELAQIEAELNKEIEEVDFSDMDPKDFAKLQNKKYLEMYKKMRDIERKREQEKREKEREYMKIQDEYRQNISKEIDAVAKEYPILKENSKKAEAFRNLVADLITAARSRGENIGLKTGVVRAMNAIGEEKVKQPKPLEKTQPYTAGVNKSEEEAMKERMLRMGSNKTLGGL